MTKNAISANGEAIPVSRRHLLGAALASTAISASAFIPSATGIGGGAAAAEPVECTDPDQAIAFHGQKLAEALCRKHGGLWKYILVSNRTIHAFWFERQRDDFTGTLATFE